MVPVTRWDFAVIVAVGDPGGSPHTTRQAESAIGITVAMPTAEQLMRNAGDDWSLSEAALEWRLMRHWVCTRRQT